MVLDICFIFSILQSGWLRIWFSYFSTQNQPDRVDDVTGSKQPRHRKHHGSSHRLSGKRRQWRLSAVDELKSERVLTNCEHCSFQFWKFWDIDPEQCAKVWLCHFKVHSFWLITAQRFFCFWTALLYGAKTSSCDARSANGWACSKVPLLEARRFFLPWCTGGDVFRCQVHPERYHVCLDTCGSFLFPSVGWWEKYAGSKHFFSFKW